MYIENIENGYPFRFRTKTSEIHDYIDLSKVRYMAIVYNEKFSGYYEIRSFNFVESDSSLIEFDLYNYHPLGFDVVPEKTGNISFTMAYDLFLKYCNDHKVLKA